MDFYPLNLVLAVATASATIFLGFLPAKNVRGDFFGRQTLVAGLAWILVGITSAPVITHDHILIALVCFASWWQLRRERGFSGKMWLCLASGLGISLGVVFILVTTPRAYPAFLSPQEKSLLLASLYLGGAVIGLAYVCFTLVKNLSSDADVTPALARRYVGLLGFLVLARTTVLFVSFCYRQPLRPRLIGTSLHDTFYLVPSHHAHLEAQLLFATALVLLPLLTFATMRAVRSGAFKRASLLLIALGGAGFISEILARLLMI